MVVTDGDGDGSGRTEVFSSGDPSMDVKPELNLFAYDVETNNFENIICIRPNERKYRTIMYHLQTVQSH
jgi:hypothetical protein